jgi:hypothetical protein
LAAYSDFRRDKIEDFNFIYLIRSAERYVVWLDKAGDIDWMTTDEYDEQGAKDQQYWKLLLYH